MKTTVKAVVECYKTLGEAKVSKLEDSEVVKVVKARKAMRKVADEYDAFLKDAQEKFKPEDFEKHAERYNAVRGKILEGEKYKPTDEELESVKAIGECDRKINMAIGDELKREVEIEVEPLKEESATKLLTENGWEIGKLDLIEIVL